MIIIIPLYTWDSLNFNTDLITSTTKQPDPIKTFGDLPPLLPVSLFLSQHSSASSPRCLHRPGWASQSRLPRAGGRRGAFPKEPRCHGPAVRAQRSPYGLLGKCPAAGGEERSAPPDAGEPNQHAGSAVAGGAPGRAQPGSTGERRGSARRTRRVWWWQWCSFRLFFKEAFSFDFVFKRRVGHQNGKKPPRSVEEKGGGQSVETQEKMGDSNVGRKKALNLIQRLPM